MSLFRKSDRYGDKEFTAFAWFCFVALAVLLVTVVVGAGDNLWSSSQCAEYAHEYGLPTHWTMFYGCFIHLPNGHSVTSGAYQAFQAVNR